VCAREATAASSMLRLILLSLEGTKKRVRIDGEKERGAVEFACTKFVTISYLLPTFYIGRHYDDIVK
jgi:hypothetical protein